MSTDTKQPDKKGKPGILKYLDNTFSDDGLRTDVKITLTNDTVVKIIATGVITTILSTLAYFGVRGLFKNKAAGNFNNPSI